MSDRPMTDPAAPTTPRRMLGQILGRHHRQQMVSGTNCSACHNYHPTSTDLINALEAPACSTPAESLPDDPVARAVMTSMDNPESDISRAIAIIEHSRQTHVNWADWRRRGNGTDTDHEMIGDLEWHENAIRDYDHVLSVLREARSTPAEPLDVERLAEVEHEQWIAWASSIIESEPLSPKRVKRWRNLFVPYSDLTDEMKEHDRKWARIALARLRATARTAPGEHEAALKSWLMDIGRRYNESVSDPHMWIEGIKAEARQQATDDMTTACMGGFEKGREARSTPAAAHEHRWTASTQPGAAPGLPGSTCADPDCPDRRSTPAEPLDVERLAARLLEGQKRQGGSVPLADENEARAYAAWLLGASDEEAAEYARLRSPENDSPSAFYGDPQDDPHQPDGEPDR